MDAFALITAGQGFARLARMEKKNDKTHLTHAFNCAGKTVESIDGGARRQVACFELFDKFFSRIYRTRMPPK